MSTGTHRSLTLLLASVWILGTAAAFAQRNGPMTRDVPASEAQWDTVMGKAEFKEHKGKPAIVFAQEGVVAPKGLTFRNGTVEFDVDPAGMGAGLGFRMQSMETLELLYFRPQPDCGSRPDCVQYAPFTRSVLLWDMRADCRARRTDQRDPCVRSSFEAPRALVDVAQDDDLVEDEPVEESRDRVDP